MPLHVTRIRKSFAAARPWADKGFFSSVTTQVRLQADAMAEASPAISVCADKRLCAGVTTQVVLQVGCGRAGFCAALPGADNRSRTGVTTRPTPDLTGSRLPPFFASRTRGCHLFFGSSALPDAPAVSGCARSVFCWFRHQARSRPGAISCCKQLGHRGAESDQECRLDHNNTVYEPDNQQPCRCCCPTAGRRQACPALS